MKNRSRVVILKFGSSVLRSESDLSSAVHEIYRHLRQGEQVIAVVSAFGNTTDQLMCGAGNVFGQPDESAHAMLLATGEASSSALLGRAIEKAGIQARVLDAALAGFRTIGDIDVDTILVDSARLLAECRSAVVVLPGFAGRDESGDTTLTGRGGSDFTALVLAHHLSAHCVLLKDVDGLYTSDPAFAGVRPSRFAAVSYETASRLGGAVVERKAIRFAKAHRLRFSINAIGAGVGTEIGPFSDRIDSAVVTAEPLRVALLGCGTVGGGVYERLAALPELFSVTGVGTRTGEQARALGIPNDLITSDLAALLSRPCDVVVELIGGTGRAAAAIEQSLRLGRNVVTANKAVIAAGGDALEKLANENGALLRYSAAVGGVLPALETIRRAKAIGPLKEFSGVLNGTCNFVLDRLAAGETIDAAVRAAQKLGYAEAQPEFDLNGTDAAQKLILLARAAFGVSLPLESIAREGIEGLNSEKLSLMERRGQVVRLVARCRRSGKNVEASVSPIALPSDHPLAQVRGAENRLLVELEVGECLVVSGQGAGRWPTTEAVMADLFEIRRNRIAEALEELEECVA
jgi:homoserine dehydrogenase